MPILHLSQQQLDDLTQLMNRGLEDMDTQAKEGDLEADGYTAADLEERQRLQDSAVVIKATMRSAELRCINNNKLSIKSTTAASELLAYTALEAFAAETGYARETPLMASTALRDLLVDLHHLSAAHHVDLKEKLDQARQLWEAETSDA